MPWALLRKNYYFCFLHVPHHFSRCIRIFSLSFFLLFFFFFFFPDLPFVASPMLRVIATPDRLMHDSRIGNNNKQVVKVFSLPENADFTRKVGTKLVSNRAVCNRIYAAARKTHLQLVSLVFLKG